MIETPRFKVTSVGGYPIGYASEAPVFQVPDTGWNYAIVREFRGVYAERKARGAAKLLEQIHRVGTPKEIPVGSRLRHGTRGCYDRLRCRCWPCMEARRNYGSAWYARKKGQK